jgi:hypothetical protein
MTMPLKDLGHFNLEMVETIRSRAQITRAALTPAPAEA